MHCRIYPDRRCMDVKRLNSCLPHRIGLLHPKGSLTHSEVLFAGFGYRLELPARRCIVLSCRKIYRSEAGRDTGGSQFFICYNRQNTQHLDRNHTCFGKVVENIDVIDDIRQGDKILGIEVIEE